MQRYTKTEWQDHIIDIETKQIIQEGTRFTASRANNIEEGIYGAYGYITDLETLIKRLQAQLEIDGRVPGNGGSFYDIFDGETRRMTLDKTATVAVGATSAGANVVIPVASTEGFTAMTYATIVDADSYEHVLITAVSVGSLTVQNLVGTYDRGAMIARSTSDIDTENQNMTVAPFVTHSVNLVEVV